MSVAMEAISTRGSAWHRWDPHIHTPGTALNDLFAGADPWEQFLTNVERSDPPIRALGVTDYCGIDPYLEAVRHKKNGRLAGVHFIFPNVEFRLSVDTGKGSGINLHLLFSPRDEDHPEQIGRFLGGLTFPYQREIFRCTPDDLVRLGRAHNPDLTDAGAARQEGVKQFKVNPDELQEAWANSAWAQENCLIAVAGSGRDGTAGLQGDGGSWEATRKKIEGMAHIIFSASPKQIDFWRGLGAATVDDLERKWGGRKPCLHGSDAHEADRVGLPDKDRRCWLNGDLNFETMRHAAIEPEGRVHIGEEPPRGALPGNCMREVHVSNASWMKPSRVPINGGMVAIIGARGSGKTALADFIATGAFSVRSQLSKNSFLHRAAEFLNSTSVTVSWEAGDDTRNEVAAIEAEELLDAPHVQYLSQQFVEQLCSSEGMADALISEIQRVIFQAHDEADRLGADDFSSMLALRLGSARSDRDRQRQALERAADSITNEQIRKDGKAALVKDRSEKQKAITKYIADRKLLVAKGQEARAKRLETIVNAVEESQRVISNGKLQLQALVGLQSDVKDFRERKAPDWVADVKEARADALLSDEDWEAFGLKFVGDVDGLLKTRVDAIQQHVRRLEGPTPSEPPHDPSADPAVALIADGTELKDASLRLLERERDRLQCLVGIDAQNARRYKQLSETIAKTQTAAAKISAEIERAEKADDVIKVLRNQRNQAYRGIFEAVIDEERELGTLYEPLRRRIAGAKGTLSKLSFSVRRIIDLEAWTARGEELLDLRTTGPFRGKGELRRIAEAELLPPWLRGDSTEVADAMNQFVAAHGDSLRSHMPAQANYREWARGVVGWLYSTDHISVGYGLQYEGGDIEQLSSGTRGIVLLLLYLAIDADDDRPLIIDQPEENLDPQSVFQDLVPAFREAKKRRQIIIVTHNANLVVNTDVDQVIVARCGPHRPGQLPEITYMSGGLENGAIRAAVCAVLEGGERAFRERARRLRISI